MVTLVSPAVTKRPRRAGRREVTERALSPSEKSQEGYRGTASVPERMREPTNCSHHARASLRHPRASNVLRCKVGLNRRKMKRKSDFLRLFPREV